MSGYKAFDITIDERVLDRVDDFFDRHDTLDKDEFCENAIIQHILMFEMIEQMQRKKKKE